MSQPTPEAVAQFLQDCETLLQRHGKPESSFVGGTYYQDALVFDTPGLTVKRGPQKCLEVRIHYLLEGEVPGQSRPHSNPVLERDEAGTLYRYHGEWSYGRRRLGRLLAGESPSTPIQLGKGPSGWREGLD